MSQQPDTYNILEIQCMHSSDSARLFVDRIDYDQLRAENAELTAQLAAAEKDVKRLNDLETLVFNGDISIEEREPRHSEFRIHTGDTDYDKPFVGTTLRKAIDAAIAAQKEGK